MSQRMGNNSEVFTGVVTIPVGSNEGIVDVRIPAMPHPEALYAVSIANPARLHSVWASFSNLEIIDGTHHYMEVLLGEPGRKQTDGAVTEAGRTFLVRGWLLGESGRITIKHGYATGNANAFPVRVRKV